MARPQRPTKEDKNITGYFTKVEDGIKCVSAALSISNNTHVIISAPTIEDLKRAWQLMTYSDLPLDISKTVHCLYKDTTEPVVTATPEPKKRNIKMYWYYHPDTDWCFVAYPNYSSGDVMAIRIGEAGEITTTDCKIALRKAGWIRSDIEAVQINTQDPEDDIPF